MLAFFSNMFGYLLNFIYNLEFIRNYGIAIIIFTILIKIILMPITIKQQKTMKKTTKIQEQLREIQEKYKGNQEKINQESIELYKRENMSPFSGCFSAIVQIILLLSVFYLVSKPLTHMKKVEPELINNYINEIKSGVEVEENKEQDTDAEKQNNEAVDNQENIPQPTNAPESTEQPANEGTTNNETTSETQKNQEKPKVNMTYPEIAVIKLKGATDERVNINMEFFGLDLSNVPSGNLSNYKVYIIPVLYVLTSIISIRMTAATTKKKENTDKTEIDMATQMNKNMTFMMPFLSVLIAMVAPLGLALYWLTSNILTIIERLILNKYFKSEEE